MTREELRLVKVMEECAEIAHRVSKALRFGMNQVQTGHVLDNRARIIDEWHDLVVSMDVLHLNPSISPEAYKMKLARAEEYLTFSLWVHDHRSHLGQRGGEDFDVTSHETGTRLLLCPCGANLLTKTK